MNRLQILLLSLFPIILWSIIKPYDLELWIAETFPLFIGLFALIQTYKHFALTSFTYTTIFIGGMLILVGAHYSYTHVPIGDWSKTFFGFERNNYDKLGHFFQGFIATVVIKEVIYKKELVKSLKWTNFFAINFAIALSALYEILEWIVVSIFVVIDSKEPAINFLGEQDYIWDTQTDMFFATVGALVFVLIFAKYHEAKVDPLNAKV